MGDGVIIPRFKSWPAVLFFVHCVDLPLAALFLQLRGSCVPSRGGLIFLLSAREQLRCYYLVRLHSGGSDDDGRWDGKWARKCYDGTTHYDRVGTYHWQGSHGTIDERIGNAAGV